MNRIFAVKAPAWAIPALNPGTSWRYGLLLFAALTLLLSPELWAAGELKSVVEENIEWGAMVMGLFGGLALFLYGMEQMAEALRAVAGERMRTILAKLTTNRFMGAATGAFVTAVIQSSSVTTVLVVGFISAGLMTSAQSVGVIMGANIGTTITAQIVAFKVTKAALLLIAVGFGMLFFSKRERVKHYGAMVMGLGLIFFGMSVMSEAMAPLRSYQPFLDLMVQMESPLVGIVIAALFTALIQSSSATTGIVIVMASQGFITLPAGIALALGANIGTCATAILASIGKPREAVRAAAVHVLFNVAGVLLWVMFIPQLAEFVVLISPSNPELNGLERLGAETPRQIANAHTLFNVTNTIVFIWFTTYIAALVNRLIPDSDVEKAGLVVTTKYIDDELLHTPSLALDRVRMEMLHMGERVQVMFEKIMPAILSGNHHTLDSIAEMDDEVDILNEQIVTYLGKISLGKLTEKENREFLSLMEAVSDLENIGDLIETNMVELGKARLESGVAISAETRKMMFNFHKVVRHALGGAIQAIAQNNPTVAATVIELKDEVSRLSTEAVQYQAARLIANEPNRIAAYTLEVDIEEKLKRIYYFSKRIAKTVADRDE
ncbi:MAG: Na/Pi cotransporter family protein [Gammaproteobacteria bacterium]|nr:Na/Pi cotransporter family protein [Gammaproteobacteria bacterium]